MRVRLTVIPGPGYSMGLRPGRWTGKPVRIRRGPATVTGEAAARDRSVASTGTAARAGKERQVVPGARRPPSDPKPTALAERVAPPMKIRISAGLAVGVVVSALLAAPALAGPTVSIRVEGATHTLLERTRVTLPDTPPPVTGGCPANSPGNALEVATAGNWDRQAFTQTVLGESHTFADNDYWAEWLNTGSGYK